MSDNPATPKQQNVLADFGYNPNVSFDEASKTIDAIAANGWKRPDGEVATQSTQPVAQRTEGNPCTAKQAACLEKFGLDPNVTFEQARVELDKLAANNWKLPNARPAVSDYPADVPSF